MRQEERPESNLIGVKETLQQDRGPGGGHDALSHVLQPQILPESGSAPAPAYSLGGWGGSGFPPASSTNRRSAAGMGQTSNKDTTEQWGNEQACGDGERQQQDPC